MGKPAKKKACPRKRKMPAPKKKKKAAPVKKKKAAPKRKLLSDIENLQDNLRKINADIAHLQLRKRTAERALKKEQN